MRRFMSFVLAVVMLFSIGAVAYAEGNSVNEVKENKEIELSLKQAIEYALEHSRDVKIQDLDMKRTELKYEQDRSVIRGLDGIEDVSSINYDLIPDGPDKPSYEDFRESQKSIPTYELHLLELGVLDRQLKLSRQISIWNKEIKENEIKFNVEKAYFDLLQSEKDLEIAREGLELVNRQYEQSKKMYELGTISRQQLLSVELAVSQAQSGLDMATMGYELQKMSFNNTLGLPLDQKVKLTDKIEYKEHEEISLEESIQAAKENSAMLKVSQEGFELSELTFKAVKARHSTPNQYKYREQEIAVEQAAKNLDMAKNGVEMSVRAAYYSLITAEKQIKTYEKAVENAQKAYELTELSYELGQNTANDVTKARIDLMDAKKNLSKQIHAYNLALLDYKYSIGLGKNTI
ncbi:Outer membrane protein TolC [Proteiniborus ethanoligenes]|uniref:Outer membrane protein TolC n=1 Tax=Proteiniborus ethanoligenes TaxID=415015 RepID=A0A1H3LYH6_9FIRM|nr:TolC family protein [Proteiniborus ethanoligenes]SDY69587.1 Outer membrane protein TolC [Proteiniborus ethanoligenes]